MILAWRLDKASRTTAASFSGAGAQLAGGRWNHPGIAAVYASESLALAALEKFVHIQPEATRLALVAYKLEIPESVDIERLDVEKLPPDWREQPAARGTKDLGTVWLRAGRNAILKVPSAIVPAENNFLINPAHPHFRRIKIHPAQAFGFDTRMWKG